MTKVWTDKERNEQMAIESEFYKFASIAEGDPLALMPHFFSLIIKRNEIAKQAMRGINRHENRENFVAMKRSIDNDLKRILLIE